MNEITVQTIIKAPVNIVWQCWTQTEHITNWNFASPDWHCPKAENNLEIGGEFHYSMAAKDGSFSFDFWGTYNKIEPHKSLKITLGDGRKMSVTFEVMEAGTNVTEIFESEEFNSLELQKAGWQSILDNFKKYTISLSS